MLFCYLITLIPLIIGGILWMITDKFTWYEWVISFVIQLILSLVFQYVVISNMTKDVEMWSGQVTSAQHFPKWKEYYEYAVYRTEYYTKTETYTDSNGKTKTRTVTKSRQVFDHWEPTSRWHNEHYAEYDNLNLSRVINVSDYELLKKNWDNERPVKGSRSTMEHNSRMIEGDPNDYVVSKNGDYIKPVVIMKNFENRVKAAPSLFSYSEVPTNVPVLNYPKIPSVYQSDRVLGDAKKNISILEWDRMNARLNPKKKVNVIIIGFENQPMTISQQQESKWIGGKKNDLVITYGKDWVKVFGWTERTEVKLNIESELLSYMKVNGKIDNNSIPIIEKLVDKHYLIKDWHKFDYITVTPPWWTYGILIGVMILTQIGFLIFSFKNGVDKTYNWK